MREDSSLLTSTPVRLSVFRLPEEDGQLFTGGPPGSSHRLTRSNTAPAPGGRCDCPDLQVSRALLLPPPSLTPVSRAKLASWRRRYCRCQVRWSSPSQGCGAASPPSSGGWTAWRAGRGRGLPAVWPPRSQLTCPGWTTGVRRTAGQGTVPHTSAPVQSRAESQT